MSRNTLEDKRMDTSRQITIKQVIKRSLGMVVPVNKPRTLMKVFVPLDDPHDTSNNSTFSSVVRKYLTNKLEFSVNSFTGYLYKENSDTSFETFYVVQLTFCGVLDDQNVNDLIKELDKVRNNLS